MEISVYKFDRICRVCLIECTDMKSLLRKMDGEERKLFEILAFTANINVNFEDSLPKQVCGECEEVMCKADTFKRRCLDSDTILKNVYLQSVSNGETSNIANQSSIKFEIPDNNQKSKSFQPSTSVNFRSPNSFDKKNDSFKETTVLPTGHTSLSNLIDSTVPKHLEHSIKVEETDTFNEELDFSDHYNDGEESESVLNVPIKEETTVKSEGKTYLCHCGLTLPNKDKYKTHLKQENCNKYKKFEEKYSVSERIHIQNKIECVECNKKFSTPNAWKLHQRTHQNLEILQLYECKFCLQKFKNASSLEAHIEKHEKTVHSVTDSFQCSLCLRKFKNKTSLSAHIQRHEETDSIKHVCKVCKREFRYKACLENHVLTMHSKKNGNMAPSSVSKESLDLIKESHKNEKKHQCTICNKAFLMLCTLKEHMRSHTGEKPYLCSQCGRGFSQKTNLAQHMRRHQGLKPFKCENCDKRFVSKGELDAHNRKHSGAHPFVCDDCGNGFTTSSALVKHRRIHTGEKPYLCDLCPMRFAASGTLKNHRRTHTGERPFQCSYCEKAFVQRNDLVCHIRCHTGEKPFVCTLCGQSFRKASGLKAHVKIHPKESGSILHGVSMMMNGMQCAEQ